MHPIVYAAVFVVLLWVVPLIWGHRSTIRTVPLAASVSQSANLSLRPDRGAFHRTDPAELSAVCPQGHIADTVACVPIAETAAANRSSTNSAARSVDQASPRDRSRIWEIYEQIPRLPDRPIDYLAYQYPTQPAGEIVGIYELDHPDYLQRKGIDFRQIGHGGIVLKPPKAVPVRLLRLPSQQANAQVVFAGQMFGNTVVTKHTLLEGGASRNYLLIYGNLDTFPETLKPGALLNDGELLGRVGDSANEGKGQLYLEVRQLRVGVDVERLANKKLTDRSVSIVCDPRNVLPLK